MPPHDSAARRSGRVALRLLQLLVQRHQARSGFALAVHLGVHLEQRIAQLPATAAPTPL